MGSHSVDQTSSIMNPLDPVEFRRQAHLVVDFLADYYSNIDKYPVCSQVQPGYLIETMPKSAPLDPESIETILQDVQKHIIPGITHWQSPGFMAYFQSNGSTGNFLGEMLLTGFNTAGFNWLASPAATELEMVVMEWILKLLQLPKSFSFSTDGGGVIHGTTIRTSRFMRFVYIFCHQFLYVCNYKSFLKNGPHSLINSYFTLKGDHQSSINNYSTRTYV